MKNSSDNDQDAAQAGHQSCSEEKCITCFQNRGCIYEQYLSATIHTMEQSYLQSRAGTNVAAGKRA